MGKKNRRRASEADQSIRRQQEDQDRGMWPGEIVPGSGCPHGAWDEKYCTRCNEESEREGEGRAALDDITERANRQGIIELVRRFGDDPERYVRAVFREGCLHCAV